MAHHSFAMFDQSQRMTLKGTVTEFQWTNPHAFIHMSVPAASGPAFTPTTFDFTTNQLYNCGAGDPSAWFRWMKM